MERGKYARSCIQVDMTRPLLEMFSIKGRHYKVECEDFIICGYRVVDLVTTQGCSIIRDLEKTMSGSEDSMELQILV